MTSLFSTPCQKLQRIKESMINFKEDGNQQTSVSDFELDSALSTNLSESNYQTQQFEPKPFFPLTRNSLQLDKENLVQTLRKTGSLNTCSKDYEMSDLASLLNKVQINRERELTDVTELVLPLETVKEKSNKCEDETLSYIQQKNVYQTCRFIPLRKQERQVTKQQQFQMIQNDDKQKGPQSQQSKGQEYVDQTQLSMNDVYKMHVLGLDVQSQRDQQFINTHNNILNYESQENIVKVFNTETKRVLGYQNNSLLQNYDNLIKLRTHAGENQTSTTRKISKIPFKVLDAPSLQDDFYLNLIDWSSQNYLAVALSSCVYLWSARNNKVVKFCDFGADDMVCSLGWSPNGNLLAIGTGQGEIHIYDSNKMLKVQTIQGHSGRVGSLAWSNHALGSGSKDKSIILHDMRSQTHISKLDGHKQEVCGLKWSPDEFQLASGGNDNKLFVWSLGSERPLAKFSQHQAAVKALAWSPHRHGLLASGGGTADRTIRFFNTLTTQQIDWIDTESQVCNLIFSKNINEFVSTHGYSMNQIICWKYPTLEKVTTLTGHTSRVLFLAMSPDGETIVTGAGDETLRFWNLFPKKSQEDDNLQSSLIPSSISLR